MDTARLQFLDMALVAIYLISVTGLGLWLTRGVKTSRDYFLAGKTLPWWAVGMSLVVSDIGAKDMVGLAADGYRYGLVMMNFDFIGCAFPVLAAAFLFMPFLWIAGVYTVPEYLGRRYNSTVRTFFALLWAFFMMGTVGTILVSAAVMFEALLGWSFWWSVGITAVVVGVFTTMGGLKAVVLTDALSCVVLIVGAALICILGLDRAGGWEGLQATVHRLDWTTHHFHLVLPADHPAFPWPAVLLGLGFVLGPAYWIGNQAIVQRTLGAGSQNQARASYVFCAVLKLVFPVLLVLPGLIGLALFHDQLGDPSQWGEGVANRVLPLLVVNLLPTGVLGIVVGAFMAGVVANLDSYINSASTLVVTDLYQPLVPGRTDTHYLRVGQALVVVFLAGGHRVRPHDPAGVRLGLRSLPDVHDFLSGPAVGSAAAWHVDPPRHVARRSGGHAPGRGHRRRAALRAVCLGPEHAVSYLWVAWWSFVAAVAGTVVVSLSRGPTTKNASAVWSAGSRFARSHHHEHGLVGDRCRRGCRDQWRGRSGERPPLSASSSCCWSGSCSCPRA